jgi:hypothetical protein
MLDGHKGVPRFSKFWRNNRQFQAGAFAQSNSDGDSQLWIDGGVSLCEPNAVLFCTSRRRVATISGAAAVAVRARCTTMSPWPRGHLALFQRVSEIPRLRNQSFPESDLWRQERANTYSGWCAEAHSPIICAASFEFNNDTDSSNSH